MQNRKFKKLSTFIAATMLSVVTIGTTAFASPQLLFDSEEGIGIEVHCSNPNAEVILKITIPVLQEGCFGPRGEMEKHIELIMIILPKNIDVLL